MESLKDYLGADLEGVGGVQDPPPLQFSKYAYQKTTFSALLGVFLCVCFFFFKILQFAYYHIQNTIAE